MQKVYRLALAEEALPHGHDVPAGLAGVFFVTVPEVGPPAGGLVFGAVVFGGAVGFAAGDEAADVVGIAVDLGNLVVDLLHVLFRDNAVAGGFVELDGGADGEAGVTLDGEVVDFSEGAFDFAMADDSGFNVAAF